MIKLKFSSRLATVCKDYEDPMSVMLSYVSYAFTENHTILWPMNFPNEVHCSGTALNDEMIYTYKLIISWASICEHSANLTDSTTQNI